MKQDIGTIIGGVNYGAPTITKAYCVVVSTVTQPGVYTYKTVKP